MSVLVDSMRNLAFTKADYPAIALLALAFLNASGVIEALPHFLLREYGSIVVYALATPIAAWLIVHFARARNVGGIFVGLILFFLIYLAASIGASFSAGFLSSLGVTIAAVYIFQVIFISSIYFWAVQLSDDAFDDCLRLSKIFLLISCLSIVLAPWLYPSATSAGRSAGLFSEQNLAAFGALFFLVLVAARPSGNWLLLIFEACVALAAVILTFSRTGLIALIVLGMLDAIRRSPRWLLAYVAMLAITPIILTAMMDHGLLDLNFEQRQRLLDVVGVFSGEAPKTAYEYRDILYDNGLVRIKETFPLGSGIGTFHSLEFGVRHHSGQWLGVHNTYIMILGEAGLIGLLSFIFWMGLFLRAVLLSAQYRVLSIGGLVVILLSMLTTHSVLNDRIAAAVLALIMAAARRSSAMDVVNAAVTWKRAPHAHP